MVHSIVKWISYGMSILALAVAAALLFADANPGSLPKMPPAAISSAPLLLVGTAFLILQAVIRPRWNEFLKNALLAATFLLWGAIPFMPRNAISSRLGNAVIALYVLDLAWVILGSKIPRKEN
jgi:hypothetical protein